LCAAVNLVEEYWVGGGQVPDAVANLEDMRKAGASMPAAVVAVVVAALNHRGTDVAARLPPFVDVLLAASTASEGGGGGALSPTDLAQGSLALARSLHSLAEDLPKVHTALGPGLGFSFSLRAEGGMPLSLSLQSRSWPSIDYL
jgi:hypothetical protein